MTAGSATQNAPAALPSPSRRALAQAPAVVKDMLVQVIGQRRVIDKAYPGVMHLLLFWGVTIQIVGTAVNLMQMKLFLPAALTTFPRGQLYLAYELIMDLAGLAILIGVAMAFWRRLVMRPKTLPSSIGHLLPLVLLALIPIAGFFTEGLRMSIVDPPWREWSPIGNQVGYWIAGLGIPPARAMVVHESMVWVHAILAISLIATIPFTKMRHLVMAPLHIAVRPRHRSGTLPVIEDFEQAETLGAGAIREFDTTSLLSFDACLQCGRCTAACPMYAAGMSHAPHAIVPDLRTAMAERLVHPTAPDAAGEPLLGTALDPGSPWFCTTCGACVQECPAFIRPLDTIVDMRRYGVMTSGDVPKTVGDALRNLERQGNPWGMAPEDRIKRATDLGLRVLEPGGQTDLLFYMGCAAAYDERTARSVRSFVRLMTAAGVDVAVLPDETCCGETARRLGHEYMFQEMARQNIENLAQVRYSRIVTQCPHCFNTLGHEYAQLGTRLDIVHYTQLLAEIRDRLPLQPAGRGRDGGAGGDVGPVAYHDSCYLGRFNGLYREPRGLLDGAGVRRVEMKRHHAGSLCCGGGGGQMWQETPPDQRINQVRLADAVEAQASVVATACPYCLLMFDDAIRSTDRAETIQVLDIAEVLAGRLDQPAGGPA